MSMDTVINVLATITLLEMMAMIGLGVSVSQITSVAKDGTLLGIILSVQWRMLAAIPAKGFLGMFPLVAATFVIGWVTGGSKDSDMANGNCCNIDPKRRCQLGAGHG